MRSESGRAALAAAIVGWLALLSGGCGSSRVHTPEGSLARAALEDSLAAWRAGDPPETLQAHTPPIHPVDAQWQAGRKLSSYEIIEELPPDAADPALRFRVRLTAAADPKAKATAAPGETTTEYVVLGRDPIWVYRAEDYARFLNMDNNPTPTPIRKKR